jgi:hypothetical protein
MTKILTFTYEIMNKLLNGMHAHVVFIIVITVLCFNAHSYQYTNAKIRCVHIILRLI